MSKKPDIFLVFFQRKYLIFYTSIFCVLQQFTIYGKSTNEEKKVNGLDISVLPSFLYNSDKGFQFGMLGSVYYYNDTFKYPDFVFNLYAQSSLSTKKNYVNYLFFDSKHLLPAGFRFILDLSLVKNNFQQFYGFNGYEALYNNSFEKHFNNKFISHEYYAVRKISKTISIDFQGNFPVRNFRWDVGVGYYNIRILHFRFNRRQIDYPQTLYEKYVQFGVIPYSIRNGGITRFLKCALIFDTRDDESIPTKGVWIESIFVRAPKFLSNEYAYSQIAIIHRQYISLFKNLIFAYRIAFQNKVSGQMPFYMMPYLQSTYQVQEALGGVKTLRGILNERLVGNGFLFGNIELRIFAIKAEILEKNIIVAFNLFNDWGLITNKYSISRAINYKNIDYNAKKEHMHYSVGLGTRFILNHNFIVSLDYGRALSKYDGKNGFYLDLGFLF